MTTNKKIALMPGSLEMLIMQSLISTERHGYSITRHLKEVSKNFLQVEEGSLYPALHRLERKGLISSKWGTSESNRRAKFYHLTGDGRKQLKLEMASWKNMSQAINDVLGYQLQTMAI